MRYGMRVPMISNDRHKQTPMMDSVQIMFLD